MHVLSPITQLPRGYSGDVGDKTPRSQMRAADTDREQVAEQLRSAHSEGRLDLAEYDERVRRAWEARTYGELKALTADLPQTRASGATMQHRINGFAIASLVVGTIWFFWIGSILALAFGYIARKQIRQRGERGAGLATAGIMLGWVGVGTLAIILSFGLLVVVAGTDPAPAPPIPAG